MVRRSRGRRGGSKKKGLDVDPTKKKEKGSTTSREEDGTSNKAATKDGNAVELELDPENGETDSGEEDDRVSSYSNDGSEHDDVNNSSEEIAPGKSSASLSANRTTSTKKNALTHLVPGYTARMKLDSSSLDKYRCGIKELGRRAERNDVSTKDFVLEATAEKANNTSKKTKEGLLLHPNSSSYAAAYSNFKRGIKRAPDDTAGKGWFGMKPSAMTEDLKTDLAIIRNRTYLDPKRFYKSTDKHHKIVQVGTVIEGASEFYSSRLTKKERRANLTEELMADKKTSDYAKNKFKKMAREKAYQAELRKPKKRARKFF
uniref:Fcf2 pre-rRNA processing C-terminal domain-containing protein n=1 Tax=Pseudo-nitzschia australis TaxID=44445 RepID=A0A7S4AE67_9STRA|mmetsp:Transcript_4996/g.11110  ORF Transcript_4996/g.11110 Transcript_4996/m.11110 type:complete len:316 (-) Transcript_4996:157-1104(-)|eukprot:CAMPEP_0168166494 /NCGR_PEP_ID=MMETSP0139_2-20121125/2056_1 /TAXON_ID=44445 /ORGANISM="Pseudo-nitzschia australis, Strain 10249 10 AB" /LENGTH=315 /DNA_ID=CAMNT_0008083693 /DNA_START=195 /DNA_END=1142 /DNA_ORIENTATION=-